VKTVHGDVQAVVDAGLLERTEEGQSVFPYNAEHVDFELQAS
jgi:hypothetical protein